MSAFNVRWEEVIEADSPADAARKAMTILTGPPGLVFLAITTERGDELEADIATGEFRHIRQIPEHHHDFAGDKDTCVVYRECPVTWGEFTRQRRKEND